jgi:hypothetical protein
MSSAQRYYEARVIDNDVSHRFSTLKDFEVWFNTVTGGQDPTTEYSTVESWLKTANVDDILYVNDLLQMTDAQFAEIEVTCL